MADFIQGLDPSKLILAGTALAFVLSPFAAPPYNLAIFLFGTIAQENPEGIQSLQTFTGLLGISTIFDIVWMIKHDQNGFIKFLTVVLQLLKIPTFLAFGNTLRQRGAQFGGLGVRGSDLSGPTVWSMPGGFTSREGYQTVDEETGPQNARPPPGPPKPAAAPPPVPAAAPGAYQTI